MRCKVLTVVLCMMSFALCLTAFAASAPSSASFPVAGYPTGPGGSGSAGGPEYGWVGGLVEGSAPITGTGCYVSDTPAEGEEWYEVTYSVSLASPVGAGEVVCHIPVGPAGDVNIYVDASDTEAPGEFRWVTRFTVWDDIVTMYPVSLSVGVSPRDSYTYNASEVASIPVTAPSAGDYFYIRVRLVDVPDVSYDVDWRPPELEQWVILPLDYIITPLQYGLAAIARIPFVSEILMLSVSSLAIVMLLKFLM